MPESNRRRIAKNTTFLYMRMLVVMLINIFSVRYVLKGLGVVDYGVFNVVAGLVTMFSSLSSIISSATLRFHSYAIGDGNDEKVSDVFSVSVNIFGLLALVILAFGEVIGLWFINTQADIPVDRMTAANLVFQFTLLSFTVGLLTAPFSSLIFAYERMNVFSLISIAECILKFLLAYSLVYISGDHLILYGIGLFLIQVGQIIVYFETSRSGCGKYRYKKDVEKSLYKQMLTFSGWTLFSSSAGIGISQLVTMLTNVFFGPVVNAARAVAFQVNSAVNAFTGNLILAIKPPMIKEYAEGNYIKVNHYFKFSNKAVLYSLLIIILPLFFEMETVLKAWLDVEDALTILFCRLVLVYSLILSLNNPISIIIQATGNIRAYSTYVEIPTLLCFPITWVLFAIGMSPVAAFYIMIASILLSHIIRLVCLKKLFPMFSYREYVLELVIPALFIIVLASIVMFYICNYVEIGFPRLVFLFVINALFLSFLCFTVGFSPIERKAVFSLINVKRHIK